MGRFWFCSVVEPAFTSVQLFSEGNCVFIHGATLCKITFHGSCCETGEVFACGICIVSVSHLKQRHGLRVAK